jgi:hypothetical protein
VEGDDLKHDYFFPPTHLLSFDTHIVGVDCFSESCEMNFVMSNGSFSEIVYNSDNSDTSCIHQRIPDGAVIRRVKMIGMSRYGLLAGLQFFDKDNNMLLEAGFCPDDDDDDDDEKRCDIKKEFLLQENERLVGVKSNSNKLPDLGKAFFDFVFVICRQV